MIPCPRCNRPHPSGACPPRTHGDPALNDLQRTLDALIVEREAARRRCTRCGTSFRVGADSCDRCADLHAPTVAALSREAFTMLTTSPQVHHDPMLHAVADQLRDGADPVVVLTRALLASADERARLLKIATDAAMRNPPPIVVTADAFRAPARNPGARVVPTGGER